MKIERPKQHNRVANESLKQQTSKQREHTNPMTEQKPNQNNHNSNRSSTYRLKFESSKLPERSTRKITQSSQAQNTMNRMNFAISDRMS